MRCKSLLRRQALALLGSAPVVGARMSLVKSRGMLTVLNLHRVGDDRASAYEALSPRLFEEMLRWLVRHYTITTFKELQCERSWRKPPMVLSFDDGYRDFIEVVAPILDKHGLGANQNIIPACVESGRPPVTVVFQDFIGAAPAGLLREIAFPGLDSHVDPDNRIRDAMRVSAALKARPIEWQKAALLALEPQMQRFSGFRPSAMMSVTEVRQVAGSFEIGAHSFEHATMAVESEVYLQSDFARCTDWFGRVLGARPEIYAFPNGMATGGRCRAAKDAGYPVVLLVGEQFSRRATGAIIDSPSTQSPWRKRVSALPVHFPSPRPGIRMTDNPDNLRNYESREIVSYYEKQTAIEPCEQFLFEKYVPRGSAVLDMGVGAGRTTPALSGLASRYVGADYSSAMIDSCRARFPGIEFHVCDATDMSGFDDGEFDAVVFSFNGIDVISTDEGRARCFSEASRVLKDGGVFIFSSHNAKLLAVPPDYRGASPLQVVWRTLRAAGASIRIFFRGYRAGVFSSGRGYVKDPWDGGMLYFVSTPDVIRREAAAAGLALQETVGSRYPRIKSPWLSPWHYYACRKIAFSNGNGDSLPRG